MERIDGGGEGWRGIEGWPLQQKGTQMSLVGWELENTMQRRVLDSLYIAGYNQPFGQCSPARVPCVSVVKSP